MTANPVQIAAKLYECRDTMKALHGASFPTVIKEYQEHLQSFADRNKISVLDAALTLGEELEAAGHGRGVPLIFAAAVELIEPSNHRDRPIPCTRRLNGNPS